MRRRLLCLLALALLFVPILATPAAAQTSATVSGTIDDPNRSVLPGVTVTIRNLGTSVSRTVTTNPEGRYVIAGLPPGVYELRAELTSFKPHVRRNLQLTIAEALVLNITLEVGGLSEEVTVTGDTSLVNTSSAELSYLVGSEAIDQLPLNGRNYTDLALLQPGVLAYPHRDGGSVVAHGLAMSVNGQDPRSNVYLLDGTLQNDFTNGPAGSAAGTALGTETIREFRVESNAYSAEFGRNSGGQINVLTKSGANNVDGSVFEFHRNDALDARNYFDTDEKPDFHRNQFGATIGGPIARDRAFFFLGYEALIERLGRTISTVVPDDNARNGILPSGTVPVNPAVAPYLAEYPRANGPSLGQGLASYTFPFDQRLDEHFAQGRVDYNFGGGNQFFARYTLTIPTSSCRPTTRSSRAISSRATSSSPRSTAASCRRTRSTSAAPATAARASARTSRPTPRRRCRCSSRRATAWATSTSAACAASGRRAPATCGSCRTCSARRAMSCTRAAGT